MDQTTYILRWVIIGLLIVGFLLAGWRDVVLLFTRPTARLGTGLSRVWSVSRVTLAEVRYHRVWILVVLQVISFGILMLVVRPFDESERIPLYIWIALTIQQLLVLIPFGAMACMSLPRERERKTIVTTSTKPLSRFELMLGKMVGFSVGAAGILLLMGLVTWGMLLVANSNLKRRAADQYAQAETDYRRSAQRPGEERAIPPPAEKAALAETGSLLAYNYVTPRAGDFSVIGKLDTTTAPPTRWMKGGSDETAIFRFPGKIMLPPNWQLQPIGKRPGFRFYLPAQPYTSNPPRQIKLDVTASRTNQPLLTQNKTLLLNLSENGMFTANWEPDRPEELFGELDPATGSPQDLGPVELTLTCGTPGIWLRIFEGGELDAAGNLPAGTNFNVILFAGEIPNPSDPNNPQEADYLPEPHPVVEGFQRRGSQQIAGPDYSAEMRGDEPAPLEMGVFKFTAEDLKRVPVKDGKFRLTLFLDVDKVKNGDLPTRALVSVFNAATPNDVTKQEVDVVEKRRTDVDVPVQALGSADPSKRGDMYVLLYCETSGHYIGALPTSARIESPPTPFVANLFKSELTIWTEATLLIVVGVVCSIRLEWPLAMLASFTLILLGHIAEFVGSLQEYGGLGALNWSKYGNHGATWRFFDQATLLVWKSLDVLVHLVPNFSRYDATAFIMQLRNRPWMVVTDDLVTTMIYALPMIVLGYLLMRRQELG